MQELFQGWLKLLAYVTEKKLAFAAEPIDLSKLGELMEAVKEFDAAIHRDLVSSFERVVKVWQMRVAFAEKLILLDTGTFALSLTFLSSFGQHTAAAQAFRNIGFVYLAWACLLLSILAAAWHNKLMVAASIRLAALPEIYSNQQRSIKAMGWAAKLSNIVRGRFTVEREDGVREEIDFSTLAGELNSVVSRTFGRQAADASLSYGKTHAAIIETAKLAHYFDFLAPTYRFEGWRTNPRPIQECEARFSSEEACRA